MHPPILRIHLRMHKEFGSSIHDPWGPTNRFLKEISRRIDLCPTLEQFMKRPVLILGFQNIAYCTVIYLKPNVTTLYFLKR